MGWVELPHALGGVAILVLQYILGFTVAKFPSLFHLPILFLLHLIPSLSLFTPSYAFSLRHLLRSIYFVPLSCSSRPRSLTSLLLFPAVILLLLISTPFSLLFSLHPYLLTSFHFFLSSLRSFSQSSSSLSLISFSLSLSVSLLPSSQMPPLPPSPLFLYTSTLCLLIPPLSLSAYIPYGSGIVLMIMNMKLMFLTIMLGIRRIVIMACKAFLVMVFT